MSRSVAEIESRDEVAVAHLRRLALPLWHRRRRGKPPKDFPRITFHEAGHALLCWRGDIPLQRITVFPWAKTGLRGVCHFDVLALAPADPDPKNWSEEYFEAVVMSAFGGPEAERRFVWGDDRQEFSMGSMSDMDMAASLCAARKDSADEAVNYAGQLQERTRDVVKEPSNWQTIEALASYLLEHHTVMAPQIATIFRVETQGESQP